MATQRWYFYFLVPLRVVASITEFFRNRVPGSCTFRTAGAAGARFTEFNRVPGSRTDDTAGGAKSRFTGFNRVPSSCTDEAEDVRRFRLELAI